MKKLKIIGKFLLVLMIIAAVPNRVEETKNKFIRK